MLTQQDLKLLFQKGISESQIDAQLECFKKGFPFLNIQSAATIGNGILSIDENEAEKYLNIWNNYLEKNHKIVKFVPASGAASRMFKNLFEFLGASYDTPTNNFEKSFFKQIKSFAFYSDLNETCLKNEGKDIDKLLVEGKYKTIIENLLSENGMNYGALPKGMLKFHHYPQTDRTAMEEHLAEGALYARNKAGNVNVHFTVSHEHFLYFQKLVIE